MNKKKKATTFSKFCESHNCTKEEAFELFDYLLFIRIKDTIRLIK